MKIQPNLIAVLAIVMTLTTSAPALAGFEFTVSSASLTGVGNFNLPIPGSVSATFTAVDFGTSPMVLDLEEGESATFKIGSITLPSQNIANSQANGTGYFIFGVLGLEGDWFNGTLISIAGNLGETDPGNIAFTAGSSPHGSMQAVFGKGTGEFAGGEGYLQIEIAEFQEITGATSDVSTVIAHVGQPKDIYARVTLLLAPSTVPEPGTSALFVTGLLGLAGASRRRKARD